jgi:hypothetical protein
MKILHLLYRVVKAHVPINSFPNTNLSASSQKTNGYYYQPIIKSKFLIPGEQYKYCVIHVFALTKKQNIHRTNCGDGFVAEGNFNNEHFDTETESCRRSTLYAI